MIKLIAICLLAYSYCHLVLAQDAKSEAKECRIYSDFYKEYAFARRKLPFRSQRSVFLWKENKYRPFRACNNTIYFSDQDKSGLWAFEPVKDRDRTYFIRNLKFTNEYLRGSEKYQDLIGDDNREVFGSLKNSADDERFMWRLTQVPDTSFFLIRNVKLDRLLYSRSALFDFRVIDNPIKLSIWDHSEPNSENAQQFNWVLKCRNNVMP